MIKYLHTMVRVKDLEASMAFYRLLGLEETRRYDNEGGRFTLVFMAPPGQPECPVELTYNWDGDEGLPSDGRHFGHLAYEVDDIYATCAHLQANGVLINRPPRDGRMAFVRSPDNVSVELLQAGTRAVVVPFAEGGETEQALRARLLAERGLLTVVEPETLTPESLAAGVDAALRAPKPHAAFDMAGTDGTVAAVKDAITLRNDS